VQERVHRRARDIGGAGAGLLLQLGGTSPAVELNDIVITGNESDGTQNAAGIHMIAVGGTRISVNGALVEGNVVNTGGPGNASPGVTLGVGNDVQVVLNRLLARNNEATTDGVTQAGADQVGVFTYVDATPGLPLGLFQMTSSLLQHDALHPTTAASGISLIAQPNAIFRIAHSTFGGANRDAVSCGGTGVVDFYNVIVDPRLSTPSSGCGNNLGAAGFVVRDDFVDA
jgi:hypothetical protein